MKRSLRREAKLDAPLFFLSLHLLASFSFLQAALFFRFITVSDDISTYINIRHVNCNII